MSILSIQLILNTDICDYKIAEKRIVLELSLSDSSRKIGLKYRNTRGEQTSSLVTGKLEFVGNNLIMYSEAEYETVDKKGINLKSVFRYSAWDKSAVVNINNLIEIMIRYCNY